MSLSYEEILDGKAMERPQPAGRHEWICDRLHEAVEASLAGHPGAKRLARRTPVRLRPGTLLRPDLAVVAAATDKLWLAGEIVSTADHRLDTVVKKQIYEDLNLPRLWMIDPRYDNVEVYHATEHGLMLKAMLAGGDVLEEPLLPGFRLPVSVLFQASAPSEDLPR